MNREELEKSMKKRTNSIYSIMLLPILFITLIILGGGIFYPDIMHSLVNYGANEIDEEIINRFIKSFYSFALIIAIVMLACLFWPRIFDKREIDLYQKYVEDLNKLSKEIKKEKLEKKIKKLEEEKSQI